MSGDGCSKKKRGHKKSKPGSGLYSSRRGAVCGDCATEGLKEAGKRTRKKGKGERGEGNIQKNEGKAVGKAGLKGKSHLVGVLGFCRKTKRKKMPTEGTTIKRRLEGGHGRKKKKKKKKKKTKKTSDVRKVRM